jgi:hypothetical protein
MAQVTQEMFDALTALLAEQKRETAAPVRPQAEQPTLNNSVPGSFVDGRSDTTHLYLRTADGTYRACSEDGPMQSSATAFYAAGGRAVPGRVPTCQANANTGKGLCARINGTLQDPAKVAKIEATFAKRADAPKQAASSGPDWSKSPWIFPEGHPEGCFCETCVSNRERIAAAQQPDADLAARVAAVQAAMQTLLGAQQALAEAVQALTGGTPVPPPAPNATSDAVKARSRTLDERIASGEVTMAKGDSKDERKAWRRNVNSTLWNGIIADLIKAGQSALDAEKNAENHPRWTSRVVYAI